MTRAPPMTTGKSLTTTICSGCTYGKATRKPWCTRSNPSKPPKGNIKAPDDYISMDQLESSTPGLIAQLKGNPTKARY